MSKYAAICVTMALLLVVLVAGCTSSGTVPSDTTDTNQSDISSENEFSASLDTVATVDDFSETELEDLNISEIVDTL